MKIVVYTKANCPNCVSAKQLLQAKGLAYREIPIDLQPEEFEYLVSMPPQARQMPQIFINDERIGGFAGLREWIKWKEEQK